MTSKEAIDFLYKKVEKHPRGGLFNYADVKKYLYEHDELLMD